MRSRVIGGEFELAQMPEMKSISEAFYSYSSGRAALYQILMSIKLTTFKVWLPDWLCESMIDSVKRTGIAYGFYTLGADLRMDVGRFVEKNKTISENDVIVLVNYFGLVEVESTISQLRSLNVESVIVEDDVQALFSFLDNGPHAADYRFTSLRKAINAPDGGLVKTKRDMPKVKRQNTFTPYKLQGAMKKGVAVDSSDDNAYLSLFEKGEALIEHNYESGMSNEAIAIFAQTDLDAVATRRKENAAFLIKELHNWGIETLVNTDANNVPLFVPILLGNRDEVRKELHRNSIFCPVHWPLRSDMKHLLTGSVMAEKELSLVVDQRYSIEDMQSIVQVLEDTIWR